LNRILVKEFNQSLNELSDRDYLFFKIQYDTAPTLEGIKPASLMTFSHQTRDLYQLWDGYKDEVTASLGLSYFELRKTEERVVVLFYQYQVLAGCLALCPNRQFLKEQGYRACHGLVDNLRLLSKRYEANCPHEIGIFLGYPVEDVVAFIENKGAPCLLCKYWKVYHDAERALRIFTAYDEARAKVMKSVITLQKRSA
jgi:hypothetical protein